jgi:phosphopantetheinyl transferase
MSSSGDTAEKRKRHRAEGRRILALLDALPSELPLKPEEAILKRPIAYEPGGRPYFADQGYPKTDFSISHSRNMVAAAWLCSPESCRTGCDIQHCSPGKSFVEISRRFFHVCEQAYIEEDAAAQLQRFYRIWVLKEAWLKLYGLSVFDMAKAPAFSIGGNPQTGTETNILSKQPYPAAPLATSSAAGLVDFFLYELSSPISASAPLSRESYVLAAARQSIHPSGGDSEPEPEIRWFSDATLVLNRIENIYSAQSPENT